MEETVALAQEKLQVLAPDTLEFRVLDALLAHAPTAQGVLVIANDIIDASTQQNGFVQLANFYTSGLILPSEYSV
jgi:hypothetical protein